MAASYPTLVKSFSTKENFVTTVLAEHVNDLQDEVTSLEANLGTNIRVSSGWVGTFDKVTTTWNTLKDRIANIEFGLNNIYGAVDFGGFMPPGGTTGQALVKTSNADFAGGWATIYQPPTGGSTGQVLTKNSATNYDMVWSTVATHEPPAGGTTGQVLTKTSNTDYDMSWSTVTIPDPLSPFLLGGM